MSKNFTFTPLSATESAGVDESELQYDYSMHDNCAVDIVQYGRSTIVKNEEQFLLTALSYLSGFMDSPSHYISGVLIGTAGSGKTHLQHQLEDLFPDDYLYQATSERQRHVDYLR